MEGPYRQSEMWWWAKNRSLRTVHLNIYLIVIKVGHPPNEACDTDLLEINLINTKYPSRATRSTTRTGIQWGVLKQAWWFDQPFESYNDNFCPKTNQLKSRWYSDIWYVRGQACQCSLLWDIQ